MPQPRQFILPFSHAPHYADEDFVESPSNQDARAWLDRPQSWPQSRLVLSGPEGSGKTHLLHMWAQRFQAEVRPVQSLRGLPEPPKTSALAIDDADEAPDEAALFHVLNLAAEARVLLLLTARLAPAIWQIGLPDLASRVRSSAHVAIGPADEPLLRTLLVRLASDRQLIIPSALADFMLLRLPRTQAAVREAVARLDRVSMAAGGHPNRALAAAVIAEISDRDAGAGETRHQNDNPMIFDPSPALLPAMPVNPPSKPVRSNP